VGDVIHEILAHDGDGLTVEGRQARCHLDGFDSRETHRTHYVEGGNAGTAGRAGVVALEPVVLGVAAEREQKEENGYNRSHR